MVALLRIAALAVLIVGGVLAIELLPGGGDVADLTRCFERAGPGGAQAQPLPATKPTEAPSQPRPAPPKSEPSPEPIAPIACGDFGASLVAALVAFFGSLVLGGFASLLLNVQRFREIMERFEANANNAR